MKKKLFLPIGATLAVIFVLALVKYFQISAAIAEGAARQMPPEAVTSTKAVREDWPKTLTAVGTLSPVRGATLGAEELGRVAKISFESGAKVEEGQVLVELDTTVEEAELQGALAQAELATLTVKRERTLRERQANSQAELDAAEATFRDRTSRVSQLRAQILRKKIVAPFAGYAGIRLVNVGQIVQPGAPIVSVQAFDPLYVDFSLPQQAIAEAKIGSKVDVSVDVFPGETFAGELAAVQPEIDLATRTVKLQAKLPNASEKLRPGMYARVTLIAPETESVIRVPASSVLYAPYGDTVYVIEKLKDPSGKEYLGASPQVVQLGRRRGDQIAVLKGLNGDEEIVSSGVFKLRPGAAVAVNNSVAPSNEAFPSPPDT